MTRRWQAPQRGAVDPSFGPSSSGGVATELDADEHWVVPGAVAVPELVELLDLADQGRPWLRSRVLCQVALGEHQLPVSVLTLGSTRADAPVALFVGGVHGLERIGAQAVLAYLRSLVMRLRWDDSLHHQLDTVRLVFVPVLNPGGMWLGTRANPNGVDLMRSAPVDADEPVALLAGGHRISAALPWYRGKLGAPAEVEAAALCQVVETELQRSPFVLALDCHSGFGLSDRLWFPWACSRAPMPHVAEVHALGQIMDASLIHHRYVLEPQSRQYLTHGDLWDHLYRRAIDRGTGLLLPLTLEMGSWLWVKKNPRQLFSRRGIFNPELAHRQQRVLRRHLGGLDFITRAAASWQRWLPQGAARQQHQDQAMVRWYGPRR